MLVAALTTLNDCNYFRIVEAESMKAYKDAMEAAYPDWIWRREEHRTWVYLPEKIDMYAIADSVCASWTKISKGLYAVDENGCIGIDVIFSKFDEIVLQNLHDDASATDLVSDLKSHTYLHACTINWFGEKAESASTFNCVDDLLAYRNADDNKSNQHDTEITIECKDYVTDELHEYSIVWSECAVKDLILLSKCWTFGHFQNTSNSEIPENALSMFTVDAYFNVRTRTPILNVTMKTLLHFFIQLGLSLPLRECGSGFARNLECIMNNSWEAAPCSIDFNGKTIIDINGKQCITASSYDVPGMVWGSSTGDYFMLTPTDKVQSTFQTLWPKSYKYEQLQQEIPHPLAVTQSTVQLIPDDKLYCIMYEPTHKVLLLQESKARKAINILTELTLIHAMTIQPNEQQEFCDEYASVMRALENIQLQEVVQRVLQHKTKSTIPPTAPPPPPPPAPKSKFDPPTVRVFLEHLIETQSLTKLQNSNIWSSSAEILEVLMRYLRRIQHISCGSNAHTLTFTKNQISVILADMIPKKRFVAGQMFQMSMPTENDLNKAIEGIWEHERKIQRGHVTDGLTTSLIGRGLQGELLRDFDAVCPIFKEVRP